MKKLYSLLLLSLLSVTFLQAQFALKKVVLEEHTGAWCGYCADGAVRMQAVLDNYPTRVIGVAVHDGDAMVCSDGSAISSFYVGGYPQGCIDRTGPAISRGLWMSSTNGRLTTLTTASVSLESVTWNSSTREISCTVRADFDNSESGDMRLNLIVVEDNVTGTGSGYNQANYDNGTVGHTYYGAGNPIVGFNHRHVAREYLGGAWGDSGIIPSAVTGGSSYTKTYTYTLPAGYDENEVHLVGMVQRYGATNTDREIMNSEEGKLMDLLTSTQDREESVYVNAYPNPFSDAVTITFDMKETGNLTADVLDLQGKVVATLLNGKVNAGSHTLTWNGTNDANVAAANGMYLIRVSNGNAVTTKRVLLAK